MGSAHTTTLLARKLSFKRCALPFQQGFLRGRRLVFQCAPHISMRQASDSRRTTFRAARARGSALGAAGPRRSRRRRWIPRRSLVRDDSRGLQDAARRRLAVALRDLVWELGAMIRTLALFLWLAPAMT